jgi:hypothetical protein
MIDGIGCGAAKGKQNKAVKPGQDGTVIVVTI